MINGKETIVALLQDTIIEVALSSDIYSNCLQNGARITNI